MLSPAGVGRRGGFVGMALHDFGGGEQQLLRGVDQQWKDTYLRQWVSISTPFGGRTPMRVKSFGWRMGSSMSSR